MVQLAAEKVQFYRDNGYAQVDNVLSAEELEELRGYMDDLLAGGSELATHRPVDAAKGKVYFDHKINVWRDSACMAKFILHPRFAELALQLSGASAVRLFHDHTLCKAPHDAKATPWHQDLPFWPMNEAGALSIWIALDDVNEQNGCMRFIPGSYKAGKLPLEDWSAARPSHEILKGTPFEHQQPVAVPLKAGSAVFHNGNTLHSAFHNVTDKPRRALVIVYYPDGTTFSDHREHVVTSGFSFKPGDAIKGKFFPVLAAQRKE